MSDDFYFEEFQNEAYEPAPESAPIYYDDAYYQDAPEVDMGYVTEGLQLAGIDFDSWQWTGTPIAEVAVETSAAPMAGAPAVGSSTGSTAGPGANPPAKEASMSDKFFKFLNSAGDMANKYKGPLEMLARGVAAGTKGKSDAKAAQRLSDSRIQEINLNSDMRLKEVAAIDQTKQAAASRYSDSVKGLRAPGGLINQPRLKRVDGSNVYSGNGLINKG